MANCRTAFSVFACLVDSHKREFYAAASWDVGSVLLDLNLTINKANEYSRESSSDK